MQHKIIGLNTGQVKIDYTVYREFFVVKVVQKLFKSV